MKKLIKYDFLRIYKDKAFKVGIIICLILSGVSLLNSFIPSQESLDELTSSLVVTGSRMIDLANLGSAISMIIGIILCFLFTKEYIYSTIKIKVSLGFKPKEIVLSNSLVSLIYIFIIYIPVFIFSIITDALSIPAEFNMALVIKSFILIVSLALLMSTVTTYISTSSKKIGTAILFFIIVTVIPSLGANLLLQLSENIQAGFNYIPLINYGFLIVGDTQPNGTILVINDIFINQFFGIIIGDLLLSALFFFLSIRSLDKRVL